MPITSILILVAIVSAFMLFGAVLAWGEYQNQAFDPGYSTTHRSERQKPRLNGG